MLSSFSLRLAACGKQRIVWRTLASGASNLRPPPCARRENFAHVTADDVIAFADALTHRDGEASLTTLADPSGRVIVLCPDLARDVAAGSTRSGSSDSTAASATLGSGNDINYSKTSSDTEVVTTSTTTTTALPPTLTLFSPGVDDGDLESLGDKYGFDWLRQYRGRPPLVLLPRSSEQVSRALRHANGRRIAVVPRAGNTGLSGGSVPVHDEVVVSCEQMDSVVSVDEDGLTVEAGAGCVLENLDARLAECDPPLMAPLDLGSKGSCTIGGNVSTNAGGLRVIRYGSLRGLVLSATMVLADGTIVDTGRPLRKDNTGYHLPSLALGSEGTLGFVTRVGLSVVRRPSSVLCATLSLSSFEHVPSLLRLARGILGETLSAFEYYDSESVKMYALANPGAWVPEGSHRYHVLIEVSGTTPSHDAEKLDTLLETAMARDVVCDGAVAQDGSQLASMWALREGISPACTQRGALYKYDLSVPVRDSHAIAEAVRERLGLPSIDDAGGRSIDPSSSSSSASDSSPYGACEVVTFGHLGDGNVHLNITAREQSQALVDRLEPFIYDWTAQRGGSVSAEHGVGMQKRHAVARTKDPATIATMRRIKEALDPRGILNPYKIFLEPQEEEKVGRK